MINENTPLSSIRRIAFADVVIIILVLCGLVASFGSIVTSVPDRLVVFRQNSIVAEYPLKDNITFTVNGKRGLVGVEIENGAAAILHTDCPRKICQMSGTIKRPREQLICAPNNILIEIRSSKNDAGLDGISY